jgi:hypothetical protein
MLSYKSMKHGYSENGEVPVPGTHSLQP